MYFVIKQFESMYARLLFREELGGEGFFLLGREGGFVGGESLGLVYGCEVALRGRVEERKGPLRFPLKVGEER